MRLNIVSGYGHLAEEVAETLRSAASGEVCTHAEATIDFQLRHQPGVSPKWLARVMKTIRPLEPDLVEDESLTDFEAALHLGDTKPLKHWRIKVFCESSDFRKDLRAGFRQLGFANPRSGEDIQVEDRLHYGGASAFARNVIAWRLGRAGCRPIVTREWGEEDPDVFVHVVDPAMRHLSPAERLVVEIRSDYPGIAIAATGRLRHAGFPRTEIKLFADDDAKACGERLAVDSGPLGRLGLDVMAARLVAVAGEVPAASGVDTDRYPVRSTKGGSSAPILYLPVNGCLTGRLPPYAGPHPERFEVCLHTDDRRASADLIREFKTRGFTRITRRSLDDVSEGFRITYGALHSEPAVLEAVREAVEAHMCEIGADMVALLFLQKLPPDSTKIVVQVPSAAFKEGRLARELENPVLYNVFIRGGGAKILATVTAAVRGLGFTTVEPRSGPVEGNPRLTYGGAPRPLLDRVRTAVHQATGMSLPLVREASVTDRDIWLVLPSDAPQGDARLPAPPPPRSSGTRHKRSGKATGRRSVRIESDCVEIGGQRIARRLENDTAHVPLLERFQPYCLDAVTVATLCHLRSAVSFCEPCALEGATSTSKTSSILFLASLLNQPVFRLNLNGQTDTGDLIGRFVPAQDGGWRFHEGLLVTAMRKGYWIILDEINLAEPAVLERLNSVLERFPTLVLSEYDNSVIEPHENFRIFATLNPAGDYVGREAMSPAFRDRWQAYLYIPRSGESEYLALAQLVVRGCQPAISVGDESFDGFVDAAPLTNLSQVRGIDKFLRAFARFHASVEAAAEPDESGVSRLGAGRRERYVFTRRGFTNTLWYMERALDGERHERRAAAIGWRAIERYYLNKLASPADRTAVTELARAAGISADGWKDLA